MFESVFLIMYLLLLLLLLYSRDRQERYIKRWVAELADQRVTHEIRSIWVSYLSQVHFYPTQTLKGKKKKQEEMS